MAEILTESFCERCGSRYTFESAVPRARLRGVKVLSRGLKNFVLDDKTSIDEAMAAARDDTDRALTADQLEAFHKTFNFCMQCRQYICPDCWNDADGRCLTCAPLLGHGILPAPFPDLDPPAAILAPDENGLAAPALNGHGHGADEPNGFDPFARLDALNVAAMATPPAPEMIGTSEVEARAEAAEELAAAETVDDAFATAEAAATAEAVALEAVTLSEVEVPVLEDQPPAPESPVQAETLDAEPEATVEDAAAEAHVEAEPVAAFEASEVEPDVPPGLAAAPSLEAIAAADGDAPLPDGSVSDDTEETTDRLAAAAQTSLLLAGLQPGQSLDEAIAAFESQPAIAAELGSLELEPVDAELVESAPAVAAQEAVVEAVVVEAAMPDPETYVEPLDEIPTAEAVQADAPIESPAEPEGTWHPEPLVDLAPAEPIEPEPVVLDSAHVEPIVVEPAVVEPIVVEPVVETLVEPPADPLEIAAAAAAVDLVDQPTWSIVAPVHETLDGVPGQI